MDYTDEELDAMMQEDMMNSGEAVFFVNPANMKKISLDSLKFSDNEDVFNTIKNQISNREFLNLEYGVDDGSPYYTISNGKRLYLNEEILKYVYNWLEYGITNSPIPSTFVGVMNADEIYGLRLIIRDRHNGWTLYNPNTGYKSKSENGIITYGNYPYSHDEFIAKLASIPEYDF